MAHNADAEYSFTSATDAEIDRLQVDITGTLLKWTCPRCQAEFSDELPIDQELFGFEIVSVEMGKEDEGVLDLVCECGTKHDGGEEANCGFAVHLPVKRE